MTEYDYSEEGRRRYIATQNRIAKWVDHTESAPQLKSPFTPRSNTGSDATVRPLTHGPSRAGSHRPSMMQYSRGPTAMTQKTYRPGPSHAGSRAPPSAFRSQFRPSPSQSGSRASGTAAPTVYPSESISQAPMSMRSENTSPSSHHSRSTHTSSSSHHSHHTHHHHRPPTYIISPPPSPAASSGVIIFPRRGKAPKVVYY